MILLIDIGNSRLKWALWDGVVLSPTVAVTHRGEPATALSQLPQRPLQAVWIAHVVGQQHEAAIAQAVTNRFGVPPRFARSGDTQLGLRSAYAEPARLGVDRWLMMLAAWSERREACCVVSAGTALTFDAVDAEGRHQGGFIAPGLTAMLQATLGNTRFPTAELGTAYHDGLGRDTEACVRQGAFLAALGAVERGVRAAGAPPVRYLCGGDAAVLLPHLGSGWQQRDDLVLRGLLALSTARR
ncbi:MAG: type III pantothenate kinase [Nevskiaceae bacterium]|nr:MAG: type III pantothenate kinase [Nevskiaceae bacterium]